MREERGGGRMWHRFWLGVNRILQFGWFVCLYEGGCSIKYPPDAIKKKKKTHDGVEK